MRFKDGPPVIVTGRVWVYGLCTALLVWPAVYNRFPLVFADTGTYLAAAIEGGVPTDRPVYYSIFITLIGLLQSLHVVPIVQALLVVGVMSLALSAMLGPIRPLWLLLTVGVLALLTPLPWLVSWLMPDMLAGVMMVAFMTLAVYWQRLTPPQRIVLGITLVLTSIVATGNLLLLLPMAGCFVVGQWAIERRLTRSTAGALAGTLLVSYALAILPNYAFHGRATLTPDSHVFLAARLFEGGLMAKYLEDKCPEPSIPLCPHLDEVRRTSANDFLWAANSLARRTKARVENLQEYQSLTTNVIFHNPLGFILQGLSTSVELLLATGLGENLVPHRKESYVFETISAYYPGIHRSYLLARQQQAALGVENLEGLYRGVTYASYIALAILVWWWARQGMRELVAAGSLVLLALLLNALIFGFLSTANVRYQVRLTWIATFFVLVGVLQLTGSAVVRNGVRAATRRLRWFSGGP